MRVPLRQTVPIAAVALCCALAGTAGAADAPGLPLQLVDVVGRVTGPGGRGLEGVRVVLDGVPDASATTDEAGSYTLTIPIEALGDPAKKAVTARVTAQRPGWGFTLRNGQGALALELRVRTRTEPVRCRVRSNVLSSVDALAASILRGDRIATVANIDFVGEEGAPSSGRVSLRSEAITVVGDPAEPEARAAIANPRRDTPAAEPNGGPGDISRGPAPASGRRAQFRQDTSAARGRPAADRPSPRPRVRRIEAQRAARDSSAAPADPGSIKLPGPGVTQTDASIIRRIEAAPGSADLSRSPLRPEDVLAAEGECACRIRGTVEIHPDHLLSRRLELIVTLREAPALRDTIQLFMGSPRPFELPAVRCGTWHVEVDAVARRDFSIVSADGRGPVDCREGGLRQLRVVLDPN